MWYGQKIERDLNRWQAAGWISESGSAAIRADLASRKPPFGAAAILAMLGAVLFGFAIMSFVAANWNVMSKLARLMLLLSTLWACYGGAAYLFRRQLPMFAQAAVLGGVAVYGASIMLIAQMYHMEGSPPDAVLLWALGALLAAVLVPSAAALAAAFVLIVVWTWWSGRSATPRTLASWRCGPPPLPPRCGCAGARACTLPPSASSSGWCRSGSSSSIATRTGWWR
jgi:uncharacterized membrane protein